MVVMRTVILGDRPPEIEEWLRLRRERGQDSFDEVWEGVYHVAPAPHRRHGWLDRQVSRLLDPLAERAGLYPSGPCNIGVEDDHRVPDGAYFRDASMVTWSDTAAIVVEIVSPDDETWAKLGFYHRHGVDELIIADPKARTVDILVRGVHAYEPATASALLGISATDLHAAIRWPD